MGASFAKAIIPRRVAAKKLSDTVGWEMGWSFPIKTDSAPNLNRAPLPKIISEGADSAAALCLLQDGANTEDRS
jgi:hypothetical protein